MVANSNAHVPCVPRVSGVPDASDALGARGEGHLAFARIGGRAVVTSMWARSPLKLLSPKNHGSASWAYASSFGGGLVDGDRIRLDVEVARGASAYLSTQSSTKVYRGRAESALVARVDRDALLALVPDPVVCFEGARYAQTIDVSLAEGASLVSVDAFTAGRSARGERWVFESLSSTLRVSCSGRVVLLDPLRLSPAHGSLVSRMGRFDVVATVVLLGAHVQAHARALLESIASSPPERNAASIVAASALGDDGAFVRIASTSVSEATARVRELLAFLPALLGDDPWARKH